VAWVTELTVRFYILVAMPDASTNYTESLRRLFENSRGKTYPKNQLIHYQGDPLTQVYLVKSGYIKAYTILESGDTRTILLLSQDDIFPLAFSATLDWQNYQIRYFYQSLTDTELLVMPSEELMKRIATDQQLSNVYMTYLAASNEVIMQQLEIMKIKKAIDKVLLSLPYLISKSGKNIKPDIYELQLKLSHQEVADLTGVTRETTTTLIKQLEERKILRQQQGNWQINMSVLQKALEGKWTSD
jgi:CRP-like cAMP-binding protein